MSQSDLGSLPPASTSGTELASLLTSWRDAVHSFHSGTSRPPYAAPGTIWLDTTSSTVQRLKVFDGTDDITLIAFDTGANRAMLAIDEDGDSYLARDGTDDVLDAVVAGARRLSVNATGLFLGNGAASGVALDTNASSAYAIPYGNSGARPSSRSGLVRFNSDIRDVEVNDGSSWYPVASGASPRECRFDYGNSTTCKLNRYRGHRLRIGDTILTIPSSGASLSNSGLSPSTLYYVYAYDSGGSVALEASTTGFAFYTDGTPYKSGDTSRLLVGMVYTSSSSTFVDSSSSRLVASYWNRLHRVLTFEESGDITTSSTSFTTLSTTLYWLDWGSEWWSSYGGGTGVVASVIGVTKSDTNYTSNASKLMLNGATKIAGSRQYVGAGSSASFMLSLSGSVIPSHGLNSIALQGKMVGAATGTWTGEDGYLQTTASFWG